MPEPTQLTQAETDATPSPSEIGKFLEQLERRSVVAPADKNVTYGTPSRWGTFFFISAGDDFPEWGTDIQRRDLLLRRFSDMVPLVAGAMDTIAARNATFAWTLKGDPAACDEGYRILNTANESKGWVHFVTKSEQDRLGQDKGAFVEIVREANRPDAPTLGIKTLDASRCWHTGDALAPVVYLDKDGKFHRLKWYQVVTLAEMPRPHELHYGLQRSAVTRVLQSAKKWRNIEGYLEEKTGGRHTKTINVVQGVVQAELEDAVNQTRLTADAKGQQFYMQPVVLAAMQKDIPVNVATIELASLPEGWDEEKAMKVALTMISLGFLCDYQELAPLASGAMGSASQSETLDRKSNSKGAGIFRESYAQMLNWSGILPQGCTFEWEERDIDDEKLVADTKKIRAEGRSVQIQSGELDPHAARQIAVSEGDVPEELLAELETRDAEREAKEAEQAQADAALQMDLMKTRVAAVQSNAVKELTGEARDQLETDAAKVVKKALDVLRKNTRTKLEELE